MHCKLFFQLFSLLLLLLFCFVFLFLPKQCVQWICKKRCWLTAASVLTTEEKTEWHLCVETFNLPPVPHCLCTHTPLSLKRKKKNNFGEVSRDRTSYLISKASEVSCFSLPWDQISPWKMKIITGWDHWKESHLVPSAI